MHLNLRLEAASGGEAQSVLKHFTRAFVEGDGAALTVLSASGLRWFGSERRPEHWEGDKFRNLHKKNTWSCENLRILASGILAVLDSDRLTMITDRPQDDRAHIGLVDIERSGDSFTLGLVILAGKIASVFDPEPLAELMRQTAAGSERSRSR